MSVIGLRVGPFEIAREAQVPAEGAWYHAHRAGLTRRAPHSVLVELLPPDASADDRAAMQRRYEALRAIDDPRIPAPVAVYEGTGAIAVTAPSGPSLSALVGLRAGDQAAMSPATLLDLALDLAEVLQHAHHRGQHHGRMWPGCVTLAPDGKLCVWGFGDARRPPPDSWRAPDPAPTAATDQWSLAAVIVGLVTGRGAGGSEGTDATATVEAQWPALGRLLRRMLSRSPEHRFPSLHPVRQELLALARKAGGTSDRRDLATRLAALEDGSSEVDHPTLIPEPPPGPSSAADAPTRLDVRQDALPVVEDAPELERAVIATTPSTPPQRPSPRPPLPDEPMPVVRPTLTDDLPEAQINRAPTGRKPAAPAFLDVPSPTAVPLTSEEAPAPSAPAPAVKIVEATWDDAPAATDAPTDVLDPESIADTETPAPSREQEQAQPAPKLAAVEFDESEEADAEPTMLFGGVRMPAADDLAEETTGPTAVFDAREVARLLGGEPAEDDIDLGIADPSVVLDEDVVGRIRVSEDEDDTSDDGPSVMPEGTDAETEPLDLPAPAPTRAFTVAVVMVGAMILAMVAWFAVGLAR